MEDKEMKQTLENLILRAVTYPIVNEEEIAQFLPLDTPKIEFQSGKWAAATYENWPVKGITTSVELRRNGEELKSLVEVYELYTVEGVESWMLVESTPFKRDEELTQHLANTNTFYRGQING